tara:strand:- start:129 stop:260 length:132 start_codon:yes stop_codon:yes gene_type:complete
MESMVGDDEHSNHTTEGQNDKKQIIKNEKDKYDHDRFANPFKK